MISNLTPSAEAFLANMNRVQHNVEEASRQVSSGKRVNMASDAPDEIDSILQLHADQARNTQIEANLGLAATDAQTADGALNSATQLMDRARVLGAQGATFTVDATGRQSIAEEVQSLLEQMVAVSQTTVQGRYIFSGDQDSGPAYTLDLTQPTGVIGVNDSTATRRVEDPAGGSFAVTKGASEIFDARNDDGTPADNNVFAALNNLRLALTNNDTDGINAAVQSVQLASNQLNTAQAFYGSVENRIQDATSYANSFDLQLKTELSQKVDADVTSAAMTLNQGTIQLQAAFQMEAKMPHTSLFDYIG
ncbi:MAG TPA: flagellin [Candidatus Acidoferrales bacterium]|nr:flagellin [Candidatus Acidoferrales bacterium]